MKIDRLLSIIIQMLNRDRVNAEELAAKYEVSVRTIYRDMEVIGAAGIPLVSSAGKNGGYGIMENYRIDRQVLGIDELLSIISALKSVYGIFEDRQTQRTLEKISSLVPKNGAGAAVERSGIAIDSIPWGADTRVAETGRVVYQSIQESRLLRFEYRGWKDESLERECEPITLVFKGHNWYLFAFCRLRNDFRFFKLSRIRNASIQDEKFTRKTVDYRSYARWEQDEKKLLPYRLKFTGQTPERLSEYFKPSSMETLPDGSVLVSAAYPDDEWVYRFFLSCGDGLEVLSPPRARERLAAMAGKVLEKYLPEKR